MMIRTFSGTHDWDPSALIDTDAEMEGNADEIVYNIASGRCPRCEGPLPTLPDYPAGSRATACRSIPVCGRCGSDEVYENLDAATGKGCGISSVGRWPLDVEEIGERRTRYEQLMKPAILTPDEHLVTEDGSSPVTNPRNTGGWAQYGAFVEEPDGDN